MSWGSLNAELANSSQRAAEALVRLLNIQLQLSRLRRTQLLSCFHLVERDEPLHNLAAAIKVLVCDLIDALDHVAQQRVQLVLG